MNSTINSLSLSLSLGVLILAALISSGSAAAANYSITYNSGLVSGMPADISDVSVAEDVTLPSTQPTRSGYIFNGWCTIAGSDTCTGGTIYTAGSTWALNQTSPTNTLTLYAMWKQPCAGYTAMQSLNSSNIATLLPSAGSTATVCDIRDDTKYVIGKLADSKVWMLDNLALDPTTVSLDDLKGNTHASDQTLTYLKNGSGSSPYPATGVIAKTSTGGSWANSYDAPYIATTDIDTVPSNPPSNGAGSNKVGVYYNYCAASAGSYCYANNAGTGDASEDLCPSGWRMPTGNTSGEFQALYNEYNAYDAFRTALSLPLSGYFNSGSASSKGSYGYWWSSTRNGGNLMYGLRADTSSIYPATTVRRYYGYSLRCVLGS